jgi:integrase/recombinase XerD
LWMSRTEASRAKIEAWGSAGSGFCAPMADRSALRFPSGSAERIRRMFVVGEEKRFQTLRVAPGRPEAYWTVVDADFQLTELADIYLRDLRLGRGRAVSTTQLYATNLTFYFDWLNRLGISVEDGPQHLGRFVHWLKTSPVTRAGAGSGRPRDGGRINHILGTVREMYKHAVSAGRLEPAILNRLYMVGDDRCYPAEARRDDGLLRSVLRPVHSVRVTRQASVDAARPEEFDALFRACLRWRDRFLLVLLYFAGLRVGEALGLRVSDLHFVDSAASLGCSFTGPHLHVTPRENQNGASVKSGRKRIVPVEVFVLQVFDRYLRRERDACPAAAACDFVLVNLWSEPLGAPMKKDRVQALLRALSRRAGLERPIHPHMLRHSAGTAWARATGISEAQSLLGHASPSSTGVYLHSDEDDMREAVRLHALHYEGARGRRSEG